VLSDGAQPTAYEFDGYRLDLARRSLTQADGGAVKLMGKPFDTLVDLVEHAGEVIDRDAIVHAVWPRRVVEDNNLNQAIAVLRRLLGEQHIATVPGRGYQFVTPVRRTEAPQPLAAASARHGIPHDDEPLADRGALPSAPAPSRRSPPRALWVMGGLVTVGLSAAAVWSGPGAVTASSLGDLIGVVPVTRFPGEESTPALSPDGKFVAFSQEDATGQRDLYVAQIGTETTLRVTQSDRGFVDHPAWSPDEQWLAFLRQYDQAHFDVVIVRPLGGVERTLHSGERYWISVDGFPLLAWTPDNREIWFTTRLEDSREQRFGLHRLVVATGVLTPLSLADERQHYDTSPAISPDGRWLAFTRYRRSERLNRIFLQQLGEGYATVGEPQSIEGLEPAIYHSLAWSREGDRLRFASGAQLFEWQVDGAVRVAHNVGPAASITAMTIAENGSTTRVAMIDARRDVDLLVLPLDPVTHAAAGPLGVRAKSTALEQHPQFSPDGSKLAFVSDRSGGREVWIADRIGEHERQLTDVPELIIGYPRWSPDGARIAFHTSSSNGVRAVYSVVVATGATQRLFDGCCPGGWSTDGESLYVTNEGKLQRIAVADGRRETLFQGETAIESADGRYLLYSKSSAPGYFRRLLAHPGHAPGAEEKLVGDYLPSRGGLAPVADGFFYVGVNLDRTPRAVRFYDYELGQARDIAPAPAQIEIGLTVSPDGRELLLAGVAGAPESDVVVLEFAQARR
jgi:Tol biopolymer transport system component/DNA-binding winged helix-turn-helix (wHTH) protein